MPVSQPPNNNGNYYILNEDGSKILLENVSGVILLEEAAQSGTAPIVVNQAQIRSLTR